MNERNETLRKALSNREVADDRRYDIEERSYTRAYEQADYRKFSPKRVFS